MPRDHRSAVVKLVGLVSVVVACLCLLSSSTSARAPSLLASFHDCGDLQTINSYDIRAKRVDCSRAKRIVRIYNRVANETGDFSHIVLGFRCRVVGHYGDGGIQRCAAEGHRVVRFLRGG